MGRILILLILIAGGASAVPPPLSAQAAGCTEPASPPKPQELVVCRFAAAFNRHDLDSLLVLADTAISWLDVVGDSVQIQAHGHEGLRVGLASYFQARPTSRSSLESVRAVGQWVSAWDRVLPDSAKGASAEVALTVYEVRDGKVRRVWYYPATRLVPR